MVMERLDATRRHPGNNDPVKQFAIAQATRLLVDAGVTDPGPLTAEALLPLPEEAIHLPDLIYGGNDGEQLRRLVTSTKGVIVSAWTDSAISRPDFPTSKEPQTTGLARVSPRALGMRGPATMSEILERGKLFGLGEVSPEAAVYQRIADTDQPLGDVYWMAMKSIAVSDGDPDVFRLLRGGGGGGRWLDSDWAGPEDQWGPETEFVFSSRPSTEAQLGAGQASSEA